MIDPRDYEVAADIARAETLPSSAFTDPSFLELELRTIFARSWLLVPGARVEERETHVPASVVGRPVLVRRDGGGALRSFPNVCTHAWHTLAPAPGRGHTLVCPQHGRTFDGDGRCVAQRGFTGLPDFPRREDHLAALPVASWGPLTFVAFEPPARTLDALLAPVRASLGSLALERLEPRAHVDEVREVEGNWKLHGWNFMDTFHIPHIHRGPGGLATAVDLASYVTELHEGCALQWAWARDPRDGFEPDLLAERFRDSARRVYALWWFLFPNVTLNFYPWGVSVNVYEPVPGRPDRTRFLWMHLVLDAAKYEAREERWFLARVDEEDVAALRQVRRGVQSGFAGRGRFAPELEKGPHWFHRHVSVGLSCALVPGSTAK